MTQTYFKTPRSEPPDPLEAMPIPNPYDIGSLYIQVLHGPKSDDRQQHGFTVIRAMDMNDQYYPFVIPLAELFAKAEVDEVGNGNVVEQFKLTILTPTGVVQHEER